MKLLSVIIMAIGLNQLVIDVTNAQTDQKFQIVHVTKTKTSEIKDIIFGTVVDGKIIQRVTFEKGNVIFYDFSSKSFNSVSLNGQYLYSSSPTNGEYIGIVSIIKPLERNSPLGVKKFTLFSSIGKILWGKIFDYRYESSTPGYYVSSAGNVIEYDRISSELTFFDVDGGVINNITLFSDPVSSEITEYKFASTISGDVVYARIMNAGIGPTDGGLIIFAFDKSGNILWRQQLPENYGHTFVVSDKNRLIGISAYQLDQRNVRGTYIIDFDGKIVSRLDGIYSRQIKFSRSGDNLILRDEKNSIINYSLPENKIFWSKSYGNNERQVYGVESVDDGNLIIVLSAQRKIGKRIRGEKKNVDWKLSDIRIELFDKSGNLINEFLHAETIWNSRISLKKLNGHNFVIRSKDSFDSYKLILE